jgi:predicted phage terminase large subunit-like protein
MDLTEVALRRKRQGPPVVSGSMPFREYVEPAWARVEPATPFVPGFHIDAICAHLQAITDGQLQNLIINIPPRHGKSTLVAVLWPTWEWTRAPWLRILFASYSLALSIRDSLKCRRLIESPWYQQQWGRVFRLTSDQNQKTRFENDRTGYRVATSVGGTGTGEGGDRLVIDDPLKAEDAESDTMRESSLDWFDSTWSTRGNDPATVARVIVMQRLHEADLVGHLLEKMQAGGQSYDHLVLSARYEPTVQVCMADLLHDARTEPGEPLSPGRFPIPALDRLEADLGEHRAAGQLQQRPAPAGGAVFKTAWWAEGRNRYDAAVEVPVVHLAGRWLFFDTAMKDQEQHDFTACSVAELLPDYRVRWRAVWRAKLPFPLLVTDMDATARQWSADGLLRGIVVEDKQSGTSAYQTLRETLPAELAGLLTAFLPHGSKLYRARLAATWCARDCILLPHPSPEAPWLLDFESELHKFPAAAHDDQVDTFSMGILFLEHLIAEGWHARGGSSAAARTAEEAVA